MLIWRFSYLDLVPKICPTIRLDTPIPIICTEVASPMAVPRVAWGTTRGIDGHILACNRGQTRQRSEKSKHWNKNQNSLFEANIQQQRSRWLPAIWWRPEEGQRWRPEVQTQAAWGQRRPLRKCPADPQNPGTHKGILCVTPT